MSFRGITTIYILSLVLQSRRNGALVSRCLYWENDDLERERERERQREKKEKLKRKDDGIIICYSRAFNVRCIVSRWLSPIASFCSMWKNTDEKFHLLGVTGFLMRTWSVYARRCLEVLFDGYWIQIFSRHFFRHRYSLKNYS